MVEFNKFNSLLDLDALRSVCEQNGRVVKFKKGECFAYAGDVLGRWGFINKGLFSHVVHGTEGSNIVGFTFEDSIVAHYMSLMRNIPLPVDIVALADSEVIVCTGNYFKEIIGADPKKRLDLSEGLFEAAYELVLSVYSMTPKERYIQLLECYPKLLQHVTLKQLASFLRITPTYLSRIRKEIAGN